MLIAKDEWERKIFTEFATAANMLIDPGSVVSGTPPQPDILFSTSGQAACVELVEITDQGLAKNHMKSLKTGRVSGGFFSQEQPLETALFGKARKTYRTQGAPLDLVAYYDKQFPAVSVEPDLIQNTIGAVAAGMVDSGVWRRIWVYDSWSKSILWVHPSQRT